MMCLVHVNSFRLLDMPPIDHRADKTNYPVRLAGTDLGKRAHICGFFNNPDEQYGVLLPFIQEGLELGEKAIHTVDPRRREEHLERLASAGIDIGALQQSGQFELRDWNNTQFREEPFDGSKTLALWEGIAKEANQSAFPLTRFVTDMEWFLETNLEADRLLEYEAMANGIWYRQDGPVNPVICSYDITKFKGDIVVNVMRTHPLVIIGGMLQENPFYVPPEDFLKELREKRTTRA